MFLKKIFIIITIIGFQVAKAQEYSVNFNVQTDTETKEIIALWQDYLKSNDRKHWNQNEVKDFKNVNFQNMPSLLNPPLLDWKLNNRVLSITPLSKQVYLLKSIFFNNENQIFATTNIIVKKVEDEFKLSNFIYDYTNKWNVKQSTNIKYIATPSFKIKRSEVRKAEQFFRNLCAVFDITPQPITYFIAKDCDDIYTALGYDYFISKGMGTECGYFEPDNNFVFATKTGGANHYHELVHFINKFYPNANYLLLTGISAYISGEKAHFGKSIHYHIKRVNDYLNKHSAIDLSNPFDFYYMDEETNPQYVIGALLCDLIIERKNKQELINVFKNDGTDEALLDYLKKDVLKPSESLDQVLRNKIKNISQQKKFKNKLL